MENDLQALYEELEKVEMYPGEYLPEYGYSPKEEVVGLIKEDIAEAEREAASGGYEYTEEELEKERQYLCHSQGLSRWC